MQCKVFVLLAVSCLTMFAAASPVAPRIVLETDVPQENKRLCRQDCIWLLSMPPRTSAA
ncbi:hypothetical protein C8J56DRAFT_1169041 [Mycena floridula]|nr:hypothetical protein C8J56DRAFT_1169041 [Mycena floridula]